MKELAGIFLTTAYLLLYVEGDSQAASAASTSVVLPAPASCLCPPETRLVCCTDGRTYKNECAVNCENRRRRKLCLPEISIISPGLCGMPSCACANTQNTICGTDNVSYRNNCFFNCANEIRRRKGLPLIGRQNVGPCLNRNCPCTNEYKPVCASDHRTYDNACLVHCENRRHYALVGESLRILYSGPCTYCGCPNTDAPVCANDGKTYKNDCVFKCINAARADDYLPPLVPLYNGVCDCNCKNYFDPVCGTDDRSYDNICLLHCESNRRVYRNLGEIVLAYGGPCACDCTHCESVYQPVCGSDGRTYWNDCWRKCYSKCNLRRQQPLIKQVKPGYC